MKEIATFLGGSGKYMATLYEVDDGGVTCYTVSCAQKNSKLNAEGFSKVFMTEQEAETFALNFISKDSKPEFLSE